MEHLILRLEAPLMAFGGETIDNYGVIRRFPSASMLTGLLANALGWRRTESERHEHLQQRLVFAARIDREPAGGMRLTDYQTVKMGDTVDMFVQDGGWVMGWTTRGTPDKRAGDLGAVGSGPFTHIRYRDYFADMRVTVALRLEPVDDSPTLDKLMSALEEPSRPLFIGRKPCLPSRPMFVGFVRGDTALEALMASQPEQGSDDSSTLAAMWPANEIVDENARVKITRSYMLTDQRNWASGLHGGGRWVCEGSISIRNEQDGVSEEIPEPMGGETT